MSPAPIRRLERDQFVQGRLLEGVDGRPAAQDNCGGGWNGASLDQVLRGKNQQLAPSNDTTLAGHYVNHTDQLRAMLERGLSRDEALGALRRGAGASPIGCIKAIVEVEGVGVGEAKRRFAESPSWADVHKSHEDFADELERMASEVASAETIYVGLRNEGVAVWRPVAAARVGADTYRILSLNSEHPDESWEFDGGDVVHCADRMLSGAMVKVAVRRASNTAG